MKKLTIFAILIGLSSCKKVEKPTKDKIVVINESYDYHDTSVYTSKEKYKSIESKMNVVDLPISIEKFIDTDVGIYNHFMLAKSLRKDCSQKLKLIVKATDIEIHYTIINKHNYITSISLDKGNNINEEFIEYVGSFTDEELIEYLGSFADEELIEYLGSFADEELIEYVGSIADDEGNNQKVDDSTEIIPASSPVPASSPRNIIIAPLSSSDSTQSR